ncbi:nuclease-related domain-containing protein [Modestobacter sp. VKM Ac-2985]|uniref:nuclease-related domain-containing protein n=1 Tax=Modestobacter sp. VKM Ac-2985 TaxID=3004139 RepID=UPI0022ABB672|nr:nuclease-related domain-containing protein [Modestobacter sp. VKM Ac-2985]MCZ2839936.1 nuclease-related domain-containing protein [Modestobacter sp. VKM Ac-2985]
MALVVSAAGASLVVRHSPLLTGLVIGVYVGATAVAAIVLLSVVDGTFHPRLGRLVERSVGTDLRRIPGIHGVVSDVSFEHGNVDHVVLTPRGCLAVEVKSSFSRRRDLAKVADLAGKVAQTRDGAVRVQRLLRSRGVDVPVRPVLLFTGPGAPFMPPVVHYDDVTITGSADSTTWVEGAVRANDQLDLDTARRAADVLLAYREQRTDYEQVRAQLQAEKLH